MTRRDILRHDWPGIVCLVLALAVVVWLPPPHPHPVQWHIPVPSLIPPDPPPPVWFP